MHTQTHACMYTHTHSLETELKTTWQQGVIDLSFIHHSLSKHNDEEPLFDQTLVGLP